MLAAIKYEYLDINKILELVLKVGGEGPFFEKSVRDLVWGYKDKMLEVGNELAPQWFYTDFVGYFMNVSITFDSKRSYNESVSAALNFNSLLMLIIILEYDKQKLGVNINETATQS